MKVPPEGEEDEETTGRTAALLMDEVMEFFLFLSRRRVEEAVGDRLIECWESSLPLLDQIVQTRKTLMSEGVCAVDEVVEMLG